MLEFACICILSKEKYMIRSSKAKVPCRPIQVRCVTQPPSSLRTCLEGALGVLDAREVVDEGGLPGGVWAQEKDERRAEELGVGHVAVGDVLVLVEAFEGLDGRLVDLLEVLERGLGDGVGARRRVPRGLVQAQDGLEVVAGAEGRGDHHYLRAGALGVLRRAPVQGYLSSQQKAIHI